MPHFFANTAPLILPRTLEKIQSFVRNQGEIGRIKRFVRHLENKSQLEECNAGLDRAIELFGVSRTAARISAE